MIKKLHIKEETSLNSRLLIKDLDVLGKITLLCGGNGVGKSTLINCIKENQIKGKYDDNRAKHYQMMSFVNSLNNYNNLNNVRSGFTYKDNFDPYYVAKLFNIREKSEGQGIMYSIDDFLYVLETMEKDEGTIYIVMIDEFDSGLSVDNIRIVLEKIKDIISKRDDMQILIAFNNYYCCEFFPDNIVSMYTGKQVKFKDHKEYVDYICDPKHIELIKRGEE